MRPNDNLVMITVIFLAFILVKRIVGPRVPGYYFRTLQHKDLPPVNPYASSTARSLKFCTALCARDANCKSVYATNTTTAITSPTSSGQAVTCGLISEYVDHSLFNPGNGTYAYIYLFTTEDSPPSFSKGTYMYTKIVEDVGLVAVYDFGGAIQSLKHIGVLYNQAIGKWPRIYGQCASLFYRFEAIEGTIVSIEKVSSGKYKIHSVCKPNEVYEGEAECSGSTGWKMLVGDLGVPCVSTNCYRINQHLTAIYNGTINKAFTQYCKSWTTNSEVSDANFPLDGFSKVNAKSYCRDPGKKRRPWCQYSVSYAWCNIPKCSMDL